MLDIVSFYRVNIMSISRANLMSISRINIMFIPGLDNMSISNVDFTSVSRVDIMSAYNSTTNIMFLSRISFNCDLSSALLCERLQTFHLDQNKEMIAMRTFLIWEAES